MPAARQQMTAFALLGLAMLLWAGNSIVGRAYRFDVPPYMLTVLRWGGASLMIAPFAWRPFVAAWPALRARWGIMVLLALLGVGGFHALLYAGLQRTTASNALLVQAAIPAVVMVLDRAMFGVTSTGLQKAGVALSTIGVAFVVFAGDLANLLALRLNAGDVIVLASVVVWSLYTVLLRRKPVVPAIALLFATFVIGTLSVVPLAAGEMLAGEHIRWSGGFAAALLYLCLGPSIAAYFIYNWATEVVGPATAGQTITLLPVFGALLSAAILGETLHLHHLAGMGLILIGIGLSISALRTAGHAGAAPLEPRA